MIKITIPSSGTFGAYSADDPTQQTEMLSALIGNILCEMRSKGVTLNFEEPPTEQQQADIQAAHAEMTQYFSDLQTYQANYQAWYLEQLHAQQTPSGGAGRGLRSTEPPPPGSIQLFAALMKAGGTAVSLAEMAKFAGLIAAVTSVKDVAHSAVDRVNPESDINRLLNMLQKAFIFGGSAWLGLDEGDPILGMGLLDKNTAFLKNMANTDTSALIQLLKKALLYEANDQEQSVLAQGLLYERKETPESPGVMKSYLEDVAVNAESEGMTIELDDVTITKIGRNVVVS